VNGTREGLFAFVQAAVDGARAPLVAMPNPFYQIYEGAALLAGARPFLLDTTEANDYLPDLAAVPAERWKLCQLLFLCSPGNPTGAVLPLSLLQQALSLADRYDFLIACDECYADIYLDERAPPPGLLQACQAAGRERFERCVVFHSLSKRSSVPGLRSGFVAGDPAIMARLLRYRTYHGSAANRSRRPRRAISFHLQDGENAYRPFVLSTGEVLAYNHDVLVRRLPDGRPDYSDPDFCPVLWHNPTRPADGHRLQEV